MMRVVFQATENKLGTDPTGKIAGEGFKCSWPPLIKMDAEAKAGKLFNP